MKKYILPMVVMVALFSHIGYRYLQADSFVFDTQSVLQEALLAADQQVAMPAMAANYLVPTQSPLPEFSTSSTLLPEGFQALNY